ncbi:CsgE family curli-type amyloid fiber assembly protein [Gillisia marina]|uniref:CsgE family curli-type amyloid fiber assembly protein n=1 Tax=Gillisia marina TaxID=1167637 RepID=UPI000494BB77|nr:CsgE family curli-type amyloid fiber assembly protein [Gillisia marina]
MILSSTTVNKSEEGTITVILLIFDEDDKPIGKDRIELVNDLESIKEVITEESIIAPASKDEAKPQDGFQINGLVIENTMTKVGRDFFRNFYSEYFNKQIISPKNIEIDEIPGRGRITRISVKVGQQVLISFFARPNKDYLKQMASVSIQRTIAYIQQLEKQGNNFKYY